jgi:hypothetical protein
LDATEDNDYSDTLDELRCWMWSSYGTADDKIRAAAIKKMGGLAKCTTKALTALDA